MELENFLVSIEDGIAILTVNRPEVRNAMNDVAWEELGRFSEHVSRSDDVRVVIITGAGDKAFVAGADLKSLEGKGTVQGLAAVAQTALRKLEACDKPTIAAVNGVAFGGGCELCLACDIRLVAENAKFALPEVGLGLLPGAGGTQRLSRIIGLGRAKEVIIAGRAITGPEAVQIGLAYRCFPQGQLLEEARALARSIAAKGPLAIRLAKKIIAASMSTDQETGMFIENLGLSILYGSEDKREGIRSFFDKRQPEFKGR